MKRQQAWYIDEDDAITWKQVLGLGLGAALVGVTLWLFLALLFSM
jgi:hypothetical protein